MAGFFASLDCSASCAVLGSFPMTAAVRSAVTQAPSWASERLGVSARLADDLKRPVFPFHMSWPTIAGTAFATEVLSRKSATRHNPRRVSA